DHVALLAQVRHVLGQHELHAAMRSLGDLVALFPLLRRHVDLPAQNGISPSGGPPAGASIGSSYCSSLYVRARLFAAARDGAAERMPPSLDFGSRNCMSSKTTASFERLSPVVLSFHCSRTRWPSMYTWWPLCKYCSTRSASLRPVSRLNAFTSRKHGSSSHSLVCWFFLRLLTAKRKFPPFPPVENVRVSGSFVSRPISITLFRFAMVGCLLR